MSKIKVGKLSKSISEELDSSSDIHDFKLVITCTSVGDSSEQLESLVKEHGGIVDKVFYDGHMLETEVHIIFTTTLREYLTLCDELSGLGRDKWYFNAITDCEVLK